MSVRVLPLKMLPGVGEQQLIYQQHNTITELQRQLAESLRRQKELEDTNASLMELSNALVQKLQQEQDSNYLLNNKLIAKGEFLMTVREELDQEKKKVDELKAITARLEEEKSALLAEYEELSESLFQQANLMVSKEAREKSELKEKKEKLEAELLTVKKDFRDQIYRLAKSYNEACRDKVAEWNNIRGTRRPSQEARDKASGSCIISSVSQLSQTVDITEGSGSPMVSRNSYKLELDIVKQSPPGCLTSREASKTLEL